MMLANPTAPEITPSPGERAALPDVLDPGYLDALLAADHTFQEAASRAPELTFEELLDQKVKEKIRGVEQYAKDLAAQEQAAAQATEPITRTPASTDEPVLTSGELAKTEGGGLRERARRAIGTIALTGILAVGAVAGVTVIQSVFKKPPTEPAAAAPAPTQAPSTTEQATTSTELAPTTTQPEEPFAAKIGERLGSLSIPGICEDKIDVYEQDEADTVYDSSEGEWHFTDDAPINMRMQDPTPLGYCDRTANLPYQGRLERNDKASNLGDASQFLPVVVHEQNANGALSVYPGQKGNSVMTGHRATFSATMGDMGALEPGDIINYKQSDGKIFPFKVVGHSIEPATPEGRANIYNWSHPDSESTLSLVGCSKADGTPTSPNYRYVVRAVMIEK